MAKAFDRPHVALIIETSLAPGRDMLAGIADYLSERQPWSIYLEPCAVDAELPRWLRRWKGHGIIARIYNSRIAEAVAATGLHVVDVLGAVENLPFPVVHVDNQAIADLAAEHLMERGFRHFAFCGIAGESWCDIRRAAFAARVQAAAARCDQHTIVLHTRDSDWEAQQDALAEWIRGLPKPIGVMAGSDPIGQRVLEAARRIGVLVPEQVAVIGVDNDEPLCSLSEPPMSSVIPPHRQVGYEAAALLQQLMDGAPPPTESRLLLPSGILSRRSTDALAIDDEDVRAAIRFIRENACLGISVNDVVDHVSLSRSTLKRKFLKETGRSMHDEIISACNAPATCWRRAN